MRIIFLILFIVLFYIYLGYPLLLLIFNRKKKISKNDNFTPTVTFLISAYNEEKYIKERLENVLSLNYPKEKLEVIVISDASTDRTDDIVKQFEDEGVKLYRLNERRGKIAGQKEVLPMTKGEILVFSDVTGKYHKEAIQKLVRNFADAKVGAVTGELKYKQSEETFIGSGEKTYWRYEILIRKNESKLGGLVAVTGSIYAIRRNLYPNFPNHLADDLIIPLAIYRKGFKIIYEEEAICEELTTAESKEEILKRSRITLQNIQGLLFMKDLLNPFRYGIFSLQLWSHKVMRIFLPFLLIWIFITNMLLWEQRSFYSILLGFQVIFYLMAIFGFALHKKGIRIFAIPFYFCLSEIAVLVGVVRAILGIKMATWETIR